MVEKMAQICFLYSSSGGIFVDPHVGDFDDIVEAHEQAAGRVRALIASPVLEDWRDWTLHVSDTNGEEIFTMPFSSSLGALH
jgi:hypothetical protein